jgi:hypothetical protein
VAGKGYAQAIISDHAASQMARRGISMPLLNDILRNPEQVAEVRPGRIILQSRVQVGTTSQLVRVFVDVDMTPPHVITAYRTSKINKYWREQ